MTSGRHFCAGRRGLQRFSAFLAAASGIVASVHPAAKAGDDPLDSLLVSDADYNVTAQYTVTGGELFPSSSDSIFLSGPEWGLIDSGGLGPFCPATNVGRVWVRPVISFGTYSEPLPVFEMESLAQFTRTSTSSNCRGSGSLQNSANATISFTLNEPLRRLRADITAVSGQNRFSSDPMPGYSPIPSASLAISTPQGVVLSWNETQPGYCAAVVCQSGEDIDFGPQQPGRFTISASFQHNLSLPQSGPISRRNSSSLKVRWNYQDTVVAGLIYVPIHGQQLPGFACVPTPTVGWVSNSAAGYRNVRYRINQQREATASGDRSWAGTLDVDTVEHIWDTHAGTCLISTSRALDIGRLLFPGFVPETLLARRLEESGRIETSNASRRAAQRIARDTRAAVREMRMDSTIPIFVDIVGHSRGGAVAAEVVRYMGGMGLNTGGPTPISVVLLDGIDPEPSDLPRPYALAGNLLGDPRIDFSGSAEVTSLIASEALRPGELGSLLSLDVVEALESIGEVDEDLVQFGYPHGRARGLSGDEAVVPNTSHVSIVDFFIGSLAWNVGDPIEYGGFGTTTALGSFMQHPRRSPSALAQQMREQTRGEDENDPRMLAGLLQTTADSDFSNAYAMQQEAQAIVADPDVAAMATAGDDEALAIIESVAQSPFSIPGPWTAFGTNTPTVDAQGLHLDGGGIRQMIDADSGLYGRLALRIDAEAIGPDAVLEWSMSGPGISASELVPLQGPEVIQQILLRAPGQEIGGDILEIFGDEVVIREASVVAVCDADATADGFVDFADINLILSNFGAAGGPSLGDLDGDGQILFSDLNLVLSSWGLATCEASFAEPAKQEDEFK
ncbi:MAG: hypothetical protein ACTS27_06105 [Phycisphaerales bacterium]